MENKPVKRMNDIEKRKAMLLDVADRMFTQNGYHGVIIDEIAAEAGVVRGTVLHYFGTKENLYQEVLKRKGASLVSLFTQMASDEFVPPKDAIKSFLRINCKMSEQDRIASSTYSETEESRFNFDTVRLKTYYKLSDCLKQIIERGNAEGVWNIDNPQLRSGALMFAIYGMSRAGGTVEETDKEMYEVTEKLLGIEIPR